MDELEHDYKIIKRYIDETTFMNHIMLEFIVERNLIGEWEEWFNERKCRNMH